MASPAPEKKRSFRLGRVLLAVLALVILLLGAGLLFRTDLATWAARTYLESEGVPVHSLEVTALWTDRIEVRDIALGAERELVVEQLHARLGLYTDAGKIHLVELHGMDLHLDATGDGPLLGSLQAPIERLAAEAPPAAPEAEDWTTGDGDEALSADIPVSVVFRRSTALIETPAGPMTAELQGELIQGFDGSQTARTDLVLDSDLGRLTADLNARRSAAGQLEFTAEIADGRLDWQKLRVGSFGGRLRLAQQEGDSPSLTADFDLLDLAYTPEGDSPLLLDSGQLKAEGEHDKAALTLTLEGKDEQLSLSVTADQAHSDDDLMSTVELQGEARSAGGLARLLPLSEPKVASGSLVFQASGQGNLFDDAMVAETWRKRPKILPGQQLTLSGDVVLADVALIDGTEGISGHLPLKVAIEQRATTFSLREDAELRIEKPARARLQALGLPEDVQPLIASGLSLTLAAEGEEAFHLVTNTAWPPREAGITLAAKAASDQGLRLAATLEGEARLAEDLSLAAFNGRLDSRIDAARAALEEREAQKVRLALPLTLRYDETGLALSLSHAGSLQVGQLGGRAPLRLGETLDFTVSALTLEATPDISGYRYRLSAGEDGAELQLLLAGRDPLPVSTGPLGLRLEGGFDPARGHDASAELRLAELTLPDYAFAAEAAELDVTLNRDLLPAASRFALGPMTLGAGGALTAPLRLDGRLKRREGGYDIEAVLGLAGGLRPAQALADITARVTQDGEVEAKTVSRLLIFDPESLQPADLSPLLADLENVRGTLTAKAGLTWPRDGTAEEGQITLSGFSFESPAGTVEGLDLDLKLTGLLPLASAPAQRLTLQRLDSAVPVENIAVDFALDQNPQPHLTLEGGRFDLGGAAWRIEPTTLDPVAPRNAIAFATEALDLATFFRLIEVDGLSGSGTLKGRLPIAFEGEDVIVEDGRFEALGPGKLQIRFEALRAALSGSGETVGLAVQALEDFHYENLSVTLAKTAANDATVRLSTLGQNPAVLDGQPFQFNINLESNLTSVLAAVKQGYSLSDDALRRAWRLRE